MRSLLTSRALVLVVAAAAIATYALATWTDRTLKRLGAVRENFRGDRIVTAYGAFVVLFAAPVLIVEAVTTAGDDRRTIVVFLYALAGFGLLGFVDDVFGDRRQTGLRGHLRALLREHRVTTGLLKAVGGLALGVIVSRFVLAHTWPDAALDGFLIALTANALNLLDLRPGRMSAAFLVAGSALLGALAAQVHYAALGALAVVMVPALVAHYRDSRAQVMQGDTGSNALGATLGVAYVLAAPSLVARSVALALLVALHVAAERWSITAIIERTPVLRQLDALTGVRSLTRPALATHRVRKRRRGRRGSRFHP